jgi:DNA-binding NtrC family response regulator
MPKGKVLIVDDERYAAESVRVMLAEEYETSVAYDGRAALRLVEDFQPSVIVADVFMPHLDGFGLLKAVRDKYPEIAVILLTGHGSVEMAVRAVKDEGAYHYFEKPVDVRRLSYSVKHAVTFAETRRENEALRRQLRDRGAFGELVGTSDTMQEIYALIGQIADSSASVLITGESGTGKEVVARTIHQLSPRHAAPFVAINCSAIPDTLMESELFGHEKGAYTGAATRRAGCFELAHGGTLFLDEIAEMPALLQAKLLRVLEERKVRRLGGSADFPVDVRVLAATNKDPFAAIQAGEFREDLLYRLNVISVNLPPLRERKEDLPLLAQHLVNLLADKHGRPARFLSPAALAVLQAHDWPGNVRELRNAIERAVVICPGEEILRVHLAPDSLDQRAATRANGDMVSFSVGTALDEVERILILRTLNKTGNNKTRAAELLGLSLKTLHNKLNSYRAQGLLPAAAGGGRKSV